MCSCKLLQRNSYKIFFQCYSYTTFIQSISFNFIPLSQNQHELKEYISKKNSHYIIKILIIFFIVDIYHRPSCYQINWQALVVTLLTHKLGIFVAPLCGSEENKIFLTSQQVHSGTLWRPFYIYSFSHVLKLVLLLLQNHVKELIWLALWNLHSSRSVRTHIWTHLKEKHFSKSFCFRELNFMGAGNTTTISHTHQRILRHLT